jgi:regulator of sigma E protease
MPQNILIIVLLILGFGFVIFFHELGHFLAAKWVGIKVEQFAVGFGQAIIAWRKGIGFRVGTTNKEYRKRAEAYIDAQKAGEQKSVEYESDHTDAEIDKAAAALGLGDTEYRLNWIPLGGYVKMLGQDDLSPNSQADDPRAYNRKSIPARMLVVSAGVTMNIILAAIGFMIVFRMGLTVPPARVGDMLPGSPAQLAGLQIGDYIWTLDGKRQYDFSKIGLSSALLEPGVTVPMEIVRGGKDGKHIQLEITPQRLRGKTKEFVALGILPYHDLTGLTGDASMVEETPEKLDKMVPREMRAVEPHDTITEINGQPVSSDDYLKFDSVVQSSFGKPIVLTVVAPDKPADPNEKSPRSETIYSHFVPPFTADPFNLLGMIPRAKVDTVLPNSSALGKLLPGDVIAGASYANNNDALPSPPTAEELTDFLRGAGNKSQVVSLTVIRTVNNVDVMKPITDLQTGLKLEGEDGGKGLGISLAGYDETHAVVAQVVPDSPAARASIPRGAMITSLNGQSVSSWYDMHRIFLQAAANSSVPIEYTTIGGDHVKTNLQVDAAQVAQVHEVRYTTMLALADPKNEIRKADGLVQAAGWGITETRDLTLQFYLMLRRMLEGNVPFSSVSGPIGIFRAGTTFASKGNDWLIWFLSLISANLAVVNFLPIPIVDGGLFTFLVLEKIQGKPLSPRTQAIAQYIGLAFLLGVFVFVTYHDIHRWF